jgi:hypothetical protein
MHWQEPAFDNIWKFNRGRVPIHRLADYGLVSRDCKLKDYLSAVKAALTRCEAIHGSCGELVPKASLPTNLLLIDIDRRCLVPAPAGARYFALSYVWGNVNMFQTTTMTVVDLGKPQSLMKHTERLPRVVRDAMDATEAMDVPFLWVDALCIVQDDDMVKHDQIRQMHAIYGQAVLTLVAMHGSHADVGLFEYELLDRFRDIDTPPPPNDDAIQLVGQEELVPRVPWLSDLLTASHYNRRVCEPSLFPHSLR